MLILTRKRGEKLVISGPCTIQVVRVQGDRVRLGVIADKEVRVLRGELLKEKEKA